MTTHTQTISPESSGIAAPQGSGQDMLAPETRGLLQSRKLIELLKDAKLKTKAGVTTIAGLMAEEAGLIPPQEKPPQEAPQSQPPEQQGIASVLEQTQQAAPSVAQNMQPPQGGPQVGVPPEMSPPGMPPPEMAPPGMPPQGMPPQGMPPQGMAEGGLASIPVHIPEFKEGGVIGFSAGKEVPDDEEQKKEDLEKLKQIAAGSGDILKSLAAAGLDIASLLPRGALGAAESIITRPLRALGAPIPYLPAFLYGGDASSMTPFTDKLRRQELASAPAPEVRVETYAPTFRINPETGVAEPIGYATPQELAAEKMNAPRSGVTAKTEKTPSGSTSSKTSVSTREKAGGPTASAAPSSEAVPFQPIDMTESTLQYNRLKALQEKKPDFEAMGLANLAAQQQRDKESESFRRYAAIYGTGVQGINAGSAMVAAAGKFQDLENRAANSADAAKTALAKAKQAEAEGDVANLLKYQEEFNKHNTDYMQARATFASAKLGADSRAEVAAMRNEFNQRMSEARISAMLQGKTANLRDPNYVYDKISDNVTTQLKNAQEGPLGYKLKTVDDYTAAYDKLWSAEIARMKAGGADVSLAEGQGKNLGAKPVKNYTFDSIK